MLTTIYIVYACVKLWRHSSNPVAWALFPASLPDSWTPGSESL